MSFDKSIFTILLCLMTTFGFSQSNTITYQTKPSVNPKIDGYSTNDYSRILQSQSSFIQLNGSKVSIDLTKIEYTDKQFDSMLENARANGFENADFNKETQSLSFTLAGEPNKYTAKDIAYSILWESGLR